MIGEFLFKCASFVAYVSCQSVDLDLVSVCAKYYSEGDSILALGLSFCVDLVNHGYNVISDHILSPVGQGVEGRFAACVLDLASIDI